MNDNKWRIGKNYEEMYGTDKAKQIKEKQSAKKIGENNPMKKWKGVSLIERYGKKKAKMMIEKMSLQKLGNKNPAKRLEVREKMSLNNAWKKLKGMTYEEIFGKERAKEIKKKQSKNCHFKYYCKTHDSWIKGLTKETDERVSRMALNLKEHIVALKTRNKISNSLIGNQNTKGKTWKVKDTSKMKVASKKNWMNPEYAKKVLCVNSPNKEERHLTILLNKVLPNEYKFVGNGKLRVGRKFPDFVNKAKTKLIELYGDYYHKGQNPQDRIDYFKQYGYDTLVIWASKLYQNEKLVMDTIINFNKSK